MIKVEVVNDLFLLEQKDFQSLNSKGFGMKNNGLYELEVCEVLYLIEKGKIDVYMKTEKKLSIKMGLGSDRKLSFRQILRKKGVSKTDYAVYKDLRSRGYHVKSGLKYGFRFRVYDKGIREGDDHSLWLVEPVLEVDSFKINDMAGKNRIAHSTKKKVLLGIVDNEGSVTYLETNWKRM